MSSFNQKLSQLFRTGRAQRLAVLRRARRSSNQRAKTHDVATGHTCEREMKAAILVAASPFSLTEQDRILLLEEGDHTLLNGELHS